MKNIAISTRWFPTYEFGAKSAKLCDNVFRDFDEQAAQFSGHDQRYLQLTHGPFEGRFLSAFLGPDVAIHMEYCNQALEQEVCGGAEYYTFGVNLCDDNHFYANGQCFTADDFFLLPPSGSLHVISPVNGTVMAIAVKKEVLLAELALAPAMRDWVLGLGNTIGVLRAGSFARRLREDAIAALEGLAQTGSAIPETLIGKALVSSIVSKLALEWNGALAQDRMAQNLAYDRFQDCSHWLRDHPIELGDRSKIAEFADISMRSVEQAFFKSVAMGPLSYLRILRLHDVKRKLADPAFLNQSIGDIAAENGFWDWSRFSNHYRRHFGELPSETRQS